MKLISPKLHGILDYITGVLLILLPYLLGIDNYTPEGIFLIASGIFMLMLADFTRYEPGCVTANPDAYTFSAGYCYRNICNNVTLDI